MENAARRLKDHIDLYCCRELDNFESLVSTVDGKTSTRRPLVLSTSPMGSASTSRVIRLNPDSRSLEKREGDIDPTKANPRGCSC